MDGRIGSAPVNGCQAGDRGERDVTVDSRDRVTVDLRGLGPAVKAQAAARNLTLAAFARAAILEAMGHVADETLSLGPVGACRWPTRQAHADPASAPSELAGRTCARLGRLLRDVPRFADRRCPLPRQPGRSGPGALASTDQMAALSTDFQSFLGLIRDGRSAEAQKYREAVPWFFDEIRKHMKLTSALAAEVRLVVRFRPTEESPS